jgi:rhodanese-related sulfurtransferase
MMKSFASLVAAILPEIREVFPWDVDEMLQRETKPLILDVREADEFATMHIAGSLHVPRGILEPACEYDYEETVRNWLRHATAMSWWYADPVIAAHLSH